MSRYLLRVYTQAGYHPDRGLQSVSKARVERRAGRLQCEGFETKLLAVSSRATALAPPSTAEVGSHRYLRRRRHLRRLRRAAAD